MNAPYTFLEIRISTRNGTIEARKKQHRQAATVKQRLIKIRPFALTSQHTLLRTL